MAVKKKWVGILLGVGVAVSVGVAAVKGRGEDLVEVKTQTLETRDLVSKVSANGVIDAARKVDLSANVMGQIVNLAVREGDRVEKGDFLLQIDQTQLAATADGAAASLKALFHERDAARAAAEEARRNFERAERSFGDELIPESELDRARSAVDSAVAQVAAIEQRIDRARADLAGARDTLSKTKMTAPIGGVVTRLPVEEGEVAVIGTMNNPGTVLMTISDLSTVEAVLEVDETDIPYVALGQRAEVTIDAYDDETFEGVVTEVGSSPIEKAGDDAIDFEVHVRLEAPPAGIRPGFSCSADIITDRRDAAIALPIQALVLREHPDTGDDEEGVYRMTSAGEPGEASEIEFVAVETGITGETDVEALSGVEAGDEIVTGPFQALRDIEDGDRVEREKEREEKEGGRDRGRRG